MKSKLFTTNGHLRPYRSLAAENSALPNARVIRVRVSPQVMSAVEWPKVAARSLTVSDTVKKSKASNVWRGDISS